MFFCNQAKGGKKKNSSVEGGLVETANNHFVAFSENAIRTLIENKDVQRIEQTKREVECKAEKELGGIY